MSLDLFGLSPPVAGQESFLLKNKEKESSDSGEFVSMLDRHKDRVPEESYVLNQAVPVQQVPVKAKTFTDEAISVQNELNAADISPLENVALNKPFFVPENYIPEESLNFTGTRATMPYELSAYSSLLSDEVSQPLFQQNAEVVNSALNPLLLEENVHLNGGVVPGRLEFSPSLLGFADHGLDELILNGESAGITDGKEIQNLINKFVSRFDLEPEVVEEEFTKLAVLPGKEKPDFNLGKLFDRIGIESEDLDSAYKMVNDVVKRELVKNHIKQDLGKSHVNRAASGNSKLDELLLLSIYGDRKQPVMPNMQNKTNNLKPENNMANLMLHREITGQGQAFGKESGFSDFHPKEDSLSFMIDAATGGQALVVPDKFEISQPVHMLKLDGVNDTGSLRDAIVHDAKILVHEGGGKMDISLMPHNMGKMQVKVDTHGSQVQVEILCSNPHVRQMVESGMGDLKLSLAGANLVIDKMEVNLAHNSTGSNLGDSKHEQQDHFREQAQERRGQNHEQWENRNNKQRRHG
jgi:hypothetical protein